MSDREYRGYIITPTPVYAREWRFAYQHQDFDGPEDNRYGFGRTVEECKKAIDELEGEKQ